MVFSKDKLNITIVIHTLAFSCISGWPFHQPTPAPCDTWHLPCVAHPQMTIMQIVHQLVYLCFGSQTHTHTHKHTHRYIHPPRTRFFTKPWEHTSFTTTTHVANTLGSTSIRYRSNMFMSEQCPPRIFPYLGTAHKMCLTKVLRLNQLKMSNKYISNNCACVGTDGFGKLLLD